MYTCPFILHCLLSYPMCAPYFPPYIVVQRFVFSVIPPSLLTSLLLVPYLFPFILHNCPIIADYFIITFTLSKPSAHIRQCPSIFFIVPPLQTSLLIRFSRSCVCCVCSFPAWLLHSSAPLFLSLTIHLLIHDSTPPLLRLYHMLTYSYLSSSVSDFGFPRFFFLHYFFSFFCIFYPSYLLSLLIYVPLKSRFSLL